MLVAAGLCGLQKEASVNPPWTFRPTVWSPRVMALSSRIAKRGLKPFPRHPIISKFVNDWAGPEYAGPAIFPRVECESRCLALACDGALFFTYHVSFSLVAVQG